MGNSLFETCKVDAWMDFVSQHLELPLTLWVYPVLGYSEFDSSVYTRAVQETHKCLKVMDKFLESHTYLAGDTFTLADIVAFAALMYPMRLVIAPEYRTLYNFIENWFRAMSNKPAIRNVVGEISLCDEETLAPGNNSVEVPLVP